MRTIFISSFHPLISRNVLAPLFLSKLSDQPATRIILLASRKKESFFRDQFERDTIRVEVLDLTLGWRDRLLRYLSLVQLRTDSLAWKRRTELRGSGRWLHPLMGGRSWSRRCVRMASRILTPRKKFRSLFLQYRPDLVFSTDVQNEFDVHLMQEACRYGIRVIGMVRSWDNLTSKGLLRFLPDQLLVHNDIMRRDALRLHGVSPAQIAVIGIPHYDAYVRFRPSPRTDFFRAIRGDPAKRLIVFAPIGDRYLSSNTVDRDIVKYLRRTAPRDRQILVRFPPHDIVRNLEREKSDGRVIFERPSNRYTIVPRKLEFTREMEQRLGDTLYHAAAVVCGPSTMCIDAAVFDKPVILIGFDGFKKRPYEKSVRRYYDYNHFRPILASGGTRLVESFEELRSALEAYGNDPALDQAGRRRIVEEQCGTLDGRASERLANVLLSTLDRS